MYNFAYIGRILPRMGGEGGNKPPGGGELFYRWYIKKDTSKYAKLMVEPYICDNLHQIYRFFSFLTNNFEIQGKASSGRH